MRTYLKETIKPLMLEVVRNSIKEVTKTHDAYNTAGTKFTQTSIDDVWVPCDAEVLRLYESMFPDANSRKKTKVGDTSAIEWWLRSAYSDGQFDHVNYKGQCVKSGVYNTYGVALGFCT
jgi:hypothetical protein